MPTISIMRRDREAGGGIYLHVPAGVTVNSGGFAKANPTGMDHAFRLSRQEMREIRDALDEILEAPPTVDEGLSRTLARTAEIPAPQIGQLQVMPVNAGLGLMRGTYGIWDGSMWVCCEDLGDGGFDFLSEVLRGTRPLATVCQEGSLVLRASRCGKRYVFEHKFPEGGSLRLGEFFSSASAERAADFVYALLIEHADRMGHSLEDLEWKSSWVGFVSTARGAFSPRTLRRKLIVDKK